MSWCTIESDPGVFSELIARFGAPSIGVDEIYTLDSLLSGELDGSNVYGLIFLFKWARENDTRPTLSSDDAPSLFFARQVVTNACATQAILSVLLNAPVSDDELGANLAELKNFSLCLDYESRGFALGESTVLRGMR